MFFFCVDKTKGFRNVRGCCERLRVGHSMGPGVAPVRVALRRNDALLFGARRLAVGGGHPPRRVGDC